MKLKISLFIVAMAVMVGCSDTTNGDTALPTDGFLSGTITTTRENGGQPVTYSFNYTVVDYPTEYYPEQAGSRTLRIYRANSFASDWTGDEYGRLDLGMDSLNQDTVALSYIRVRALVPLANDTLFYAGMNGFTSGRILTYHFDRSTLKITGTYTATGNGYNGNAFTVNGEFESHVRLYLYGSGE